MTLEHDYFDGKMRKESEPMEDLPLYSECNPVDNVALPHKFYDGKGRFLFQVGASDPLTIQPPGVLIKFKPTGFRVENEGGITVDISVDPENEIGGPQYLLAEQDGDTLAVTKDCLYQLYLAACELQKP